jgi:hypothetical protein
MKRTVIFVAFFLINFLVFSQSKMINKENSTLKNQGITNLNASEINAQLTGLPDLKFTALSVTTTPNQQKGEGYYNLSISYTLKNVGKTLELLDNVPVNGYVSDEKIVAKYPFNSAQGGLFSVACGIRLAMPGEMKYLAPGAEIQHNYNCTGIHINKDPKPVYIIIVDEFNTLKETDETNNIINNTIIL